MANAECQMPNGECQLPNDECRMPNGPPASELLWAFAIWHLTLSWSHLAHGDRDRREGQLDRSAIGRVRDTGDGKRGRARCERVEDERREQARTRRAELI